MIPQQHGLLVLNKPRGLSSAQCTNCFKRLGQKKIGHAGTLDPMATGVLLILLGQATKISSYLMAGGIKTYRGILRLGQTTDTWDTEGRLLAEQAWQHVHPETIFREIYAWKGESVQRVPPFSAAKYRGEPLYRRSLAGKETPAKVKQIVISQAEVLWVELPLVSFRVTCSSGTYIRSLAHSLGTRLGCGAVLAELTREYSHPFGLEQAYSLDAVLDDPDTLPGKLLPISAGLPDWTRVRLTREQTRAACHGIAVPASEKDAVGSRRALLQDADGADVALASLQKEAGCRPVWTILRGLWQETNPCGG